MRNSNAPSTLQTVYRLWATLLPFQLLIVVGAIGLLTGVIAAITVLLLRGDIQPLPLPDEVVTAPAVTVFTGVAPTFTPEVQFWTPYILKWANQYGIEPNIIATVIQIESCGHYLVNSAAGAQGLFQVMPFHFSEGENMLDPETNARRGINYLLGGLEIADGHIGLAMAGYNGGWGVIPRGWGRWATETRNYYIWGSGIYRDALQGKRPEESEWLQSWLNAGGSRLCAWAASVLPTGTPDPAVGLPVPTTPLPATLPAVMPTEATLAPTMFIPPTITPSP
ncbi:MAG: transglycosylase SLT domain-containing protein [Anaerolineae bacterium]|nr:transglycosylase SLT domain-containing protein [Anaerolineae bacterium]